ncbi:heme o synthase [Halococcoides cellulosivorans]|uniref:Protoheme IX farnesyltransferase n=1 Tax=Halococcoides cellulosivorans TaxID=1679096 RepID=A0A2R4X1C8_9EURY|nr:heme o synthase [Halococcoides cellulosivorans]AWB27598.1 protoheme IX farnesyltransferase [Halococcoides cellulosivorans]
MTQRVVTRFVGGLVAAISGLYLLIVLGATQSLTGAADACRSWPGCHGTLAIGSVDLGIVWAHRFAAAAVGVLIVALAALAWLHGEPRRVRVALTGAALLYPVQIGIGAVLAVRGSVGSTGGAAVHLGVALVIFTALVAALAWTLEARTADRPSRESSGPSRRGDRDPGPVTTGPLATLRAYLTLTKPKLMWLLGLVAAASMALAAGPDLAVQTVVFTLTGGVLAIGASGTFNHVLERDVDQEMNRTADRPLPTAEIPVRNAVAFGLVLTALSLVTFWQVGVLATALGAIAIAFYSIGYTLVLKPNTVQNTVIGGFAGALPALIGWAAVTGTVGWGGLALGGVIFLWTPAHFYNLALAYRDDYAAADIPMMPVVRGNATTRKHVLGWLGATLVGAVALGAIGGLGPLYAVVTAAVGAVFLVAVVRLHAERDRPAAMRAFHASNAFLGLLLVTVAIDALVV